MLLVWTISYFLIISIVNVILSTVKSLCTVRYGRGIVILMNVLAYSFYTIVVKQVADLPLWITVAGTAVANAFGVWLSYIILDKFQKDRLWMIQMTIKCSPERADEIKNLLDSYEIANSFVMAGKHAVFSCYCYTQNESKKVKEIGDVNKAKFSAFESKIL